METTILLITAIIFNHFQSQNSVDQERALNTTRVDLNDEMQERGGQAKSQVQC